MNQTYNNSPSKPKEMELIYAIPKEKKYIVVNDLLDNIRKRNELNGGDDNDNISIPDVKDHQQEE